MTTTTASAPESAARNGAWRRVWEWIERRGRFLVVGTPYLWLLLFFLAPFAIVLKISFAEYALAQPPYTPLIECPEGVGLLQCFLDGDLDVRLNTANFGYLVSSNLYWKAYLNSVEIALISTVLCLLIGYPLAYGMARSSPSTRNILLMLVILPFWTSFLIRVYAWKVILQKGGVLNWMLLEVGLIDEPLQILYTNGAVYLGIVYSYLPFMVLPLYATLERLDPDLLEASADLGARPVTSFLKITLPLSLPGIIAGSLLVFIPAVGEFVIPELLGGPDTIMIGRQLWNEFFANRDWPVASAVAIAMLLLLVVPIMLFQRVQLDQAEREAA